MRVKNCNVTLSIGKNYRIAVIKTSDSLYIVKYIFHVYHVFMKYLVIWKYVKSDSSLNIKVKRVCERWQITL